MSSNIYSDGHYLEKNPTWHVEESPWKAKQILKMLALHQLRPRRIAEVGCGAGEILSQLALSLPRDVEFHGFDISPQAYEMARSKQNSRLKFYQADLTEATEHFDLLLVMDVVEHIEDYMGFLRRLRTKGSRMIFHIPLDMSVQTILRGARPFLLARETVGHLHYFTDVTALATLRGTGYTVEGYFFTAGSIELTDHLTVPGRILRWPRIALAKINASFASRLLGGFSLLVMATPVNEPMSTLDNC